MVDTHIHVQNSDLPGQKPLPESFVRLLSAAPDAMASALTAEMDRAGITTALAMGKLNGPPDDPLGINATLRIASLERRLKLVGAADPRKIDQAHLKAVEHQLEKHTRQIVGLKCYLGYLHFGPDHPNYAPYYLLARKYRLPVIFHTGDNWSTTAKLKYAHPLLVDEAAVEYPDISFVMAHFGNPWTLDAAAVIYKNDNVWADLSGLFVGDAETIADLTKQVGEPREGSEYLFTTLQHGMSYADRPDRLLYGSDWPLAPMKSYRELIAALVPREHHEAVFRTNAETLFQLRK